MRWSLCAVLVGTLFASACCARAQQTVPDSGTPSTIGTPASAAPAEPEGDEVVPMEPGDDEEASCICPRIFLPVCGVDGVTYPNGCVAACDHVVVAHDGRCEEPPPPCPCPELYAPVCGIDGVTYDSACEADCVGVAVAHDGACEVEEGCICTQQWDPVCGVDGQTYGNRCVADCAGVDVAHEGECP